MIICPIKPPVKLKPPVKKHFFPILSGLFFGLVFAGLFSGAFYVFATYGTDEPYPLGNTLTPSCTAGSSANCTVVTPAQYSFGSNNFSGTGNFSGGTLTSSTLTSGYLPVVGTAGLLQNSAGTGFVKVVGGSLSYDNSTYLTALTPAGSNTQIQYNNSNAFGASSAFTFNGNTLNITSTSAAQEKLSYNGSIYSTLTTGSDGTLTVANTGGSAGDVVLQPTGAGDVALLSDTGKMYLGGDTHLNNENLKFDFETTSNTVAITSTTGVSNLTWTGNLTLGGNATVGTLVTRVTTASAPTEADVNGSLVVDSGDGGRLYFRYGGNWHYVSQTAGFQIPNFETVDPISGDQIKEGDLVLGMVNQTLQDKALHGVWVKWDSIKSGLYGAVNNGSISGVDVSTLQDKVKNVLSSLGITFENGITKITQLAAVNLFATNARVNTLEMIDRATGDVYCTWVENGQLMRAKGECSSIDVASARAEIVSQTADKVQQAAQQVTAQAQSQIQSQVQEQVQQQLQEQTPAPAPTPETTPTSTSAPASAESSGETKPAETPAPQEAPAATVTDPVSFFGESIRNSAAGTLNLLLQFLKRVFKVFLGNAAKLVPDSDIHALSSGIKYVAKIISY